MRTTPGVTRARHPRRRTLAGAALTAAAVLALTSCGSGGDSAEPAAQVSTPPAKAGTVLDTPFDKPDLTLTDTSGEKYDLVEETKGHPTLLYFGYTNCPDICPLTMSNIAVAAKSLPEADREDLRVVFITSDPERDTPKRLGSWLRGQSPDFIGLTGDFETIQAGARSVGIGIAPPKKNKAGEIESTHGAQVVAFSPKDDKAHVLYGEDTSVDEYTEDLPKLVQGQTP